MVHILGTLKNRRRRITGIQKVTQHFDNHPYSRYEEAPPSCNSSTMPIQWDPRKSSVSLLLVTMTGWGGVLPTIDI